MTDWNLCFICQQHDSKNLPRSTTEGINSLVDNLPKFNELGKLKFDYNRLVTLNESKDLRKLLESNKAKYHNKCQSNYSKSKLDRLLRSQEKKDSKDSSKKLKTEDDELSSFCSPKTRRSTESEELKPPFPNMLQCCWCVEYDNESNLTAAGQRWAKTKPNHEHVQIMTHKWKQIAATVNHEHILRCLSHGDVSSNEMFYHDKCLTKYTHKYNDIISKGNTDNKNDLWVKELVLNKIILYIKDIERVNPGTVFIVYELESMYEDMLIGYNIKWTSHVTRFADLLIRRVPGLIRGLINTKVSVFFSSNCQSQCQKPTRLF